jgi:hypothetical protein
VDGNVLSMSRLGGTLYIAGSFRSAGETSGGGVPVDPRIGTPIGGFPKVAGTVSTILPDGSGGWYVGGTFTAVGGLARSNIAHIMPDRSVADWSPQVSDGTSYISPPWVGAIAIRDGRVFLGGEFRTVNGQARQCLACVDSITGTLMPWNPGSAIDTHVYALAVHASTVFVGGFFDSLAGQRRPMLAAVDANTGSATAWQVVASGQVSALLVHGAILFAAGQFAWLGGPRDLVAALDANTGALLPFDAHASGIQVDFAPRPEIEGLALDGDTLYVAGNFTQIGGRALTSLAALDATSGNATSWVPPEVGPQDPDFPPRACTSIAVQGGAVLVGGFFETMNGESRPFAAAADKTTGALLDWNPKPKDAVEALAANDSAVYLGGDFRTIGDWKHRAGIAAIDLATGGVKPWNPNPDGSIVTAVAASGDHVFVSGNFTSIGGQTRASLAALDTLDGEALPWNLGADDVATKLVVDGSTLYAGGYFTIVGGQTREYLASVDTRSGELLPWNPGAGWPVLGMALAGKTMYVGGLFSELGGAEREGIGAVDLTTGVATGWNPNPVANSGWVNTIVVNGNTVFVGGAFDNIGGQRRRSIAALDATTGAATGWDPGTLGWDVAGGEVKSMTLVDSLLYVGGDFGEIGGAYRVCLAAVDTATGRATDWNPDPDGYVLSLLASGSTIYAGGGFSRLGRYPSAGVAAFRTSDPATIPPPVTALAISRIAPNPAKTSVTIRLALPSTGLARLEVFDIQGRRVAEPLRDQPELAGIREVPFSTAGLRGGIYICRLTAGGKSASRKLLVIR